MGLLASVNSKPVLAAAQVLVQSSMPYWFQRSWQTKGDTMVLQGWGLWHGADDHIPIKKNVTNPQAMLTRWSQLRHPCKQKDILSDMKVAHDAAFQQWKNLTFQHILRDQGLETKVLTFKKKHNLFYWKTQSVWRSKHSISVTKPIS